MRVLQINTEKTWRGGERQTFYTLIGLNELGVDVTLLGRKNYPLSQKTKTNNLKVVEVSEHLQVIPYLILNGRKFDVIHVQTSMILTYAILTKIFHKRPVILSRRVDFVPKGILTRFKYKLADRIIGITDAINLILKEFGINNIVKISECVEPKELSKERAQKFLESLGIKDKKIVGTTAAFVPHKDPATMVKAIHELSKKRNDFVFIHFGEGELFEQTKTKVKELKLEKIYLMPGFQTQVEDYFSIFDVFTMSSEQEGLGSSVLDAFIYKVPVASTKAGGLNEIIQGNGLLSEIKDYLSLANNIDSILNNPSLSQKLTDSAYHTAITKHSIQKISQDHVDLYNQLIK